MSENILIAYYSWSGNTRKVAERIHEITGGTMIGISPEEPYPEDYNKVVDQAKKEIRNGFRPVLKSSIDNIDKYSKIFIGSPNWWKTIAPPVASFLSEHDFTGKTILPFCTHGGGGQGNIRNDIARLCPGSLVSECIEIYGSQSEIDLRILSEWLKNAGISKEQFSGGSK